MADVKVDKRSEQRGEHEQRGMERRHGAGLARRGEWWPSPAEFFTMNPFSMMRRLSEEMDRAFGSSFGLARGTEPEHIWAPAIEVRERDNKLVVCADLPGMNKDDVKVEVNEEGLVIEGERKREEEESRGGMHRTERSYGRFYRLIPLPEGAQADQANAQFKDGVLEVTVPIPESKNKPREIPIKS